MPATCGSDPIDLAPPFGGKQGTRLKMSLADFATCLTLSIAFAVRPFCSGSRLWSADAAPVVTKGCGAATLLSDGAGVWAAWAVICARTGEFEIDASSRSAATADTASDVTGKKGQ